MPERAGGVERQDIDAGFRALAGAENAREIERLIETLPVLRSPIFHAYLRQYRYGKRTELRGVPGAYEHFMEVYDQFFTHLHLLANYVQARSEPEPQSTAGAPVVQTMPPFFEAVRLALGSEDAGARWSGFSSAVRPPRDKLPPFPAHQTTGSPASMGTDTGFLVELRGGCVRAMQGTSGSDCALLLGYFEQPTLLDSLGAGAYEQPVCPRCFGRTVLPVANLHCRRPFTAMRSSAICTLCRVRETEDCIPAAARLSAKSRQRYAFSKSTWR